jgi:hypothetical protein
MARNLLPCLTRLRLVVKKVLVRIAAAVALFLIELFHCSGLVLFVLIQSKRAPTPRTNENQDDFKLAAAQTQNRQVLHLAKAVCCIIGW